MLYHKNVLLNKNTNISLHLYNIQVFTLNEFKYICYELNIGCAWLVEISKFQSDGSVICQKALSSKLCQNQIISYFCSYLLFVSYFCIFAYGKYGTFNKA